MGGKKAKLTWFSLLLMIVGGFLFVLGICYKLISSKDTSHFHTIMEPIVDVGFGLFIVGLADAVLLAHVKKSFSSILLFQKKAEAHYLEDILDPRYTEKKGERKPNDDTINRITDDLCDFFKNGDGTKKLRLYGISLKDFLSPGGPFNSFLTELISNKAFKKNRETDHLPKETMIEIMVLILDPESPIVKLRGATEGSNNTVFNDISDSKNGFYKLRDLSKKRTEKDICIKMKYTSLNPPGWFVMTDKFIIFEPYCWGRPSSKATEELTYKCLGGRMPIFQLNDNSELYKRMKEHFDFLWNAEGDFKECFGVKDA